MQQILVWIIILALLAFVFKRMIDKPYLGLPVYYCCNFLREQFLVGIQVRYQIVLQIIVIFCGISIAYISYHFKKNSKKVSIPILENGKIVFVAVVSVATIIGLANKYNIFQICVDIYKVAEIYLFYYFLKNILRKTEDIEKCLEIIIFEMCLFGIWEIFTTDRGGVGINIVITWMPIVFARGFYKKKKYYWVSILISIIIVLTSKTRTYMMGYALSILGIILIAKGRYYKDILAKGFLLGSVTVIFISFYMSLWGSEYLTELFQRILALNKGFEATGGYRIYEIEKALEKFIESPLFGKGYGYQEYVYIKLMGWFTWGDFMHNLYVEILAKTGIYGSLLYGGFIMFYLNRQWSIFKKIKRWDDKELAGIVLGGFIGTLSWLFIYFAAPLSTYGYIFMPGIISMLYYNIYKKEKNEAHEWKIKSNQKLC